MFFFSSILLQKTIFLPGELSLITRVRYGKLEFTCSVPFDLWDFAVQQPFNEIVSSCKTVQSLFEFTARNILVSSTKVSYLQYCSKNIICKYVKSRDAMTDSFGTSEISPEHNNSKKFVHRLQAKQLRNILTKYTNILSSRMWSKVRFTSVVKMASN